MKKLLFIILLTSSCSFLQSKPYRPKFISEFYVEECLKACIDHPEIYLDVLSNENQIYACHCKESEK